MSLIETKSENDDQDFQEIENDTSNEVQNSIKSKQKTITVEIFKNSTEESWPVESSKKLWPVESPKELWAVESPMKVNKTIVIDLEEENTFRVKLNYKGNKNMKTKNMYSEFPDVLNKNLLRSLRRYLNQMYVSETGVVSKRSRSERGKAQEKMRNFYQKHFKSKSAYAQSIQSTEELIVLQILAVII